MATTFSIPKAEGLKIGAQNRFTQPFAEINSKDILRVGGKNASLGEMIGHLASKGIQVPDGFATTADAFRYFIAANGLEKPLREELAQLDLKNFSNLDEIADATHQLMLDATMPQDLIQEITAGYEELCRKNDRLVEVAVRSSATAEDLPNASFAGQHESFLNRSGAEDVVRAVHQCFASLFRARAIKYRVDNGFDHMKVALSAGVQLMVRSDLASSGVCFTLDPESGFRNVILISGCWGLGENIVQGAVNPDEFVVFKPTLEAGKRALISKKLGSKAKTMIYADNNSSGRTIVNTETPEAKRKQWVLSDAEVEQLAKWSQLIEEHYKTPMDIEWAKDGISQKLFIVQARPETVHSSKDPFIKKEYELLSEGKVIVQGSAVGSSIASGVARIIQSTAESDKLQPGEVLVTDSTNPDWDPILKKASAIITNRGGRTSHAAIVAREVGAVAVVGTIDATSKIKDGQIVTVSCMQGKTGSVYEGKLEWREYELNFRNVKMPRTSPMMILGDPDQAFGLSFFPNQGIGLMRLEFIITNAIRIHPMALVYFADLKDQAAKKEIDDLTSGYSNKEQYFVDKLSQAVATIAAAFYPKDVIVRMSDFKSNEYANLLGGKEFELDEENPMIGFRGASRYYNERYREGFRLECEAMKRVREEMGFENVKLMIPFCRTVDEGKKVVALMAQYGLPRNVKGLEIYVMAEIPSNVILAKEFAEVFDGFSIGSNDLTQLTLGLDRDSAIISDLFDENNGAVKWMITSVIRDARSAGRKIGLCGQAPSDDPEFARFLVEQGIDSISFNPDALLKGIENILRAEEASNSSKS
ncbi:MAG: phosphoenolpyruvate synthase [Bacteroidota bacterium]|nr:phosphoenolpyruvate synthase [Bacteroidota bacterium]